MRLTKIQKKLKELNVGFTYEEKTEGFGDIHIKQPTDNGKVATLLISEVSSDHGTTPIGVYFSPFGHGYSNQKNICEWLERNHDKLIKVEDKVKRFPENIIALVKERFPETEVCENRNSLIFKHGGDKMRVYLDEFCETIYSMSAITHTTEIEDFPRQAKKLLKFHEFSRCLDILVDNYIIAGGKMI